MHAVLARGDEQEGADADLVVGVVEGEGVGAGKRAGQEVRRLGETRGRTVDFRLIRATNEDILKQGADGRFRRDLLSRINVFTLKLPPLRERASDIPELARHLLARAAGVGRRRCPVISAPAMDVLVDYPWPGNVRELANVLERAAALAGDGVVEPGHLGLEVEPTRRRRGTLRQTITQVERELVVEVLAAHGGNVSAAAGRRAACKRRAPRGAACPVPERSAGGLPRSSWQRAACTRG